MDIGYLDSVVAPWRSLRNRCVRCENCTYLSEKFDFRSRLFIVMLLFFWLAPLLLFAQSIKPESPIQFKIKNAGITVDGTISDWEVKVDFDSKKLAQSSIRGKAIPESIQTGIKLRDKHFMDESTSISKNSLSLVWNPSLFSQGVRTLLSGYLNCRSGM